MQALNCVKNNFTKLLSGHNGRVMKTANIADLKNRLSFYLAEVKRGGQVLVSERNVPFAKIVPQTAALVWCIERPRNRPFICADLRLIETASGAGFDAILIS